MKAPADAPDSPPLSICPCCGARLGPVFYQTGPVPVHSCLMLDTAHEAARFPTGIVALALCPDCGFVANTAFDSAWSAYAPNYEDQQSFSPTFNAFANTLAQGLVARHGLAGKAAVEIGCSKGDFLALLCEAGMHDAVGIDPSAVTGRVAPPSRGRMRLIQDYYRPAHRDIPADLICCRHTLEHIQPVHEMLTTMRRHGERRPGAVLCIEVPDATRIWADCAFEDIYYEHCSYFTPGALAAAVRRAGFAVTALSREYDDQYLVLEGCLDPRQDQRFDIEDSPAETATAIARFADAVPDKITAWQAAIDTERAAGRRIAVWGSGSKCVAFLKSLGRADAISAVFDINPHRSGKHAPGLEVPISPPAALPDIAPDTLIVMNAIYAAEIRAAAAAHGVFPDIRTLDDPHPSEAPA